MPRSPGRTGYAYRQACVRLRVPGAVCWRCGLEIDVKLRFPDRWSWTLEHKDGNHRNNHPSNHASAHLTCNSSAGARARHGLPPRQQVRRTSRDW